MRNRVRSLLISTIVHMEFFVSVDRKWDAGDQLAEQVGTINNVVNRLDRVLS